MCMRSTPVQWSDKHNRDINKVTEDTKSGSYTVQRLTSPLHDDRRATTPRQQSNLRLTTLPMFTVHLECRESTKFQVQTMVNDTHEL